ncbi:MAG: hypothetical protein NT069_27295, partial [Planctomycetota bacterium]|nr:hypothetical protein [Planctomycetota bacterium]
MNRSSRQDSPLDCRWPASLIRRFPFWLACAAFVAPVAPCGAFAAEKLQYNRDVRPILADNCFACHGPDSAARKAGLRIDQRPAAIEAGAIEPGQPDDSLLLQRILSDDPKLV